MPFLERRCPVEQGSAAYEGLKTQQRVYGSAGVSQPGPDKHAGGIGGPVACAPLRRPQGELHWRRKFCARGFVSSAAQDSRRCPALGRDRLGCGLESARRLFDFARAVPTGELPQDEEADAVFILSRHDSHARYVVAALANHKPVLVEKPLAMSREQLEEIRHAYQVEKDKSLSPFLMVGYNRRFAPFTERLKQFFEGRGEPMVVQIRVNAGLSRTITGCSRTPVEAEEFWANFATSWTGRDAWWTATWSVSPPMLCPTGRATTATTS